MRKLAEVSMNKNGALANFHCGITVPDAVERPLKAFLPFELKNRLFEIVRNWTHIGLPKGVAPFGPSLVMELAVAARTMRLAAAINGAYRGISHSSLLERFVSVRARRGVTSTRRVRRFYHPLNRVAR